MQQQTNDEAVKTNGSASQHQPDPKKKDDSINDDSETIVNEEEQNKITNTDKTEKPTSPKEKSFYKHDLPEPEDEPVPFIGDNPGEIEEINPKM